MACAKEWAGVSEVAPNDKNNNYDGCDEGDCTQCKIVAAFKRITSLARAELVAQLHDAAAVMEVDGMAALPASNEAARVRGTGYAVIARNAVVDAGHRAGALLEAVASHTSDCLNDIRVHYWFAGHTLVAAARLLETGTFSHLAAAATPGNVADPKTLASTFSRCARYSHRDIARRCLEHKELIDTYRALFARARCVGHGSLRSSIVDARLSCIKILAPEGDDSDSDSDSDADADADADPPKSGYSRERCDRELATRKAISAACEEINNLLIE